MPPAPDRFDRILELARRTVRRYRLIGVITLLGTAAAILAVSLQPRVYRSEALILYREGIRSAEGSDNSAEAARRLGLKLKEMLLSRTRLQQVIEKYGLYPKLVADRGYVDAVDEMRTHIAFRTRDGETFGVSFEGENPKRVQAVTATLSQAVLEENAKSREEQATTTRAFLDSEQHRAEEELRAKETALARFLTAHPEFAREPGASQPVPQPMRKAGKDPGLMALERQAERLEARLSHPAAAAVDPALRATRDQARTELEAARRELAEKSSQFTERHPDVVAAAGRVARAEQRLVEAEAQLNEASPPPQLERGALEGGLQRIKAEIASFKKENRQPEPQATPTAGAADGIVALETEFAQRSRDVLEARERERQLEERQFRASIASNSLSSGGSQMVIIDPAYPPTHPSKGNRTMTAAAALAASFLLGIGLAVARVLLDDVLHDKYDVDRLVLIDVLTTVPRHG